MRRQILTTLFFIFFVFGHTSSTKAQDPNAELAEIKQHMNQKGYLSCSDNLVKAFDFIAKDGAWDIIRRWYTDNTNKKPYYIYYVINGNDKQYSAHGNLALMLGSDGNCWGSYAKTTIYPNTTCAAHMSKNSITKENGWNIDSRGKNGDGGEYFMLSVEESPALTFILNDSAAGCSFTKMERL